MKQGHLLIDLESYASNVLALSVKTLPCVGLLKYSNGGDDRVSRGLVDSGALSRAQGCLLGQFAGDALGSLVEFCTPDESGESILTASANLPTEALGIPSQVSLRTIPRWRSCWPGCWPIKESMIQRKLKKRIFSG